MKGIINNNKFLSLLLASSILLSGCGAKKKSVDIDNSHDLVLPVSDNVSTYYDELGKEYYVNKSMSAGIMDEDKNVVVGEDANKDEIFSQETKIKCDFAYTIKDVSIWNNLEEKCFAGYASMYQKIMILDTDGEYSLVEYIDDNDNLIRGYIPVENYKVLPNTFISIDLSRQELTMYIDNELVLTTNVVTGHYNVNDTPSGYFAIYYKGTGEYLTGKNPDGSIAYSEYVDYWMPFNGNIGIHDAQNHIHEDGFTHGWRDSSEFSRYTYTFNGSHGCVNTSNEAARAIYENSEVGTKVLVHK